MKNGRGRWWGEDATDTSQGEQASDRSRSQDGSYKGDACLSIDRRHRLLPRIRSLEYHSAGRSTALNRVGEGDDWRRSTDAARWCRLSPRAARGKPVEGSTQGKQTERRNYDDDIKHTRRQCRAKF